MVYTTAGTTSDQIPFSGVKISSKNEHYFSTYSKKSLSRNLSRRSSVFGNVDINREKNEKRMALSDEILLSHYDKAARYIGRGGQLFVPLEQG